MQVSGRVLALIRLFAFLSVYIICFVVPYPSMHDFDCDLKKMISSIFSLLINLMKARSQMKSDFKSLKNGSVSLLFDMSIKVLKRHIKHPVNKAFVRCCTLFTHSPLSLNAYINYRYFTLQIIEDIECMKSDSCSTIRL